MIKIGARAEAFVVVRSKIHDRTEKELIPLQEFVEHKVKEKEKRIKEWTHAHREAMLITLADVQQVKEAADWAGVAVEATIYTNTKNPSHTQTHIHVRFRTGSDLHRFVRALVSKGFPVYHVVEVIE